MINYFNQKVNQETGILVVDSNKKMTSLNRNFLNLWSLPEDIIISRNDDFVLTYVSEQFDYPKKFLNDVQDIYLQETLEVNDAIQLKNGRIFERRSHPLYLENRYIGRIWLFRSIYNPYSDVENSFLKASIQSYKYPNWFDLFKHPL